MKFFRIVTIAYALLFAATPAFAARAALACLSVLEQYKKVEHYKELKEVAKLLETVDTDLLTGKKKPTFSDVQKLEDITALVVKAQRFRGEKHAEIFDALRETSPQADVTVTSGPRPMNAKDYKPNDAELKSLYQAVWNRLASELPPEMGLPLIKISYRLQKRAEMQEQGREVLKGSEETFNALFPRKSGFASFKAYETKLAKVVANDPARKATVDMLASENVEVVIQRPENTRWWVTKIGLHNQHVTGSSKGYFGKAGRNAAEASYANMSMEAFSKLDDTVKPVYGHIQPAPGYQEQIAKTTSASQYGSDGYVVNIDKVRDRLSFTYGGDSLNRVEEFAPQWSRGIAATPTSWDHTFIPWTYRSLIADATSPTTLEYRQYDESATGLKAKASFGSDYIEIQVHGGGIQLSEISAFEFSRTEPAGDFLISMRRDGLEIRKREGSKTVVWEKDLTFRELTTVENGNVAADVPVTIQSVTVREVSFKDNVLDPQYEWVVNVRTQEDLGAFTNRLKLFDTAAPERRIQPTIAQSGGSGSTFNYQIRVPNVSLHDVGKLYVELMSVDGKSVVKSNGGNARNNFKMSAIGE